MAKKTPGSGNGGDGSEEGSKSDSPEQRGAPVMGTAVISGATFTNKSVVYYEVEGVAIIEGDICLGQVDEVKRANDMAREAATTNPQIAFGVGIPGSQFRWPNCRIPYEIDPALPNQQRVTDAIAHWEANTSFRFPLRTAANAGQYPNYVRFTDAGGCWSMVGMQGGQQTISLGAGCTTGNAIHEIGHTVGLWHEQSREDRDLFVTIHWENIQSGMAAQFNQHITDGDDLGAYDYGSIMHYPRKAFSKNDQDTIVPVNAGAQIGQRTGLSAGDIAAVRAMYPACGLHKVAGDPNIFKKVFDDRHGFKKIRDDIIVVKPIRDGGPIKGLRDPIKPGRDPITGGPVTTLPPGSSSGALQPFSLATPHHASNTPFADQGGGALSGIAGGYLAQIAQQILDLDAAIAEAYATASKAQADIARMQEARDLAAATYEQAMQDFAGGM